MNKPSIYLFLACMVCFAGFTSAQINYTRSTFSAAYSPISTTGGAAAIGYGTSTTNSNTQTIAIRLPFSISYNGVVFTSSDSLAVAINGFAYLFSTSPTSHASSATSTNLYTTTAPNNTLAPWYDDLDLDVDNDQVLEGSVLYQTVAPNELVVQWTNVWSYAASSGGLSNNRQINFQIRLYGSAHATKANQIEFMYGSIAGTQVASESASIGIENATGGPGNYLDAVTNSKVVNNSMMNTTIWPKQHFRFTPSTAPAALSAGTYTVGSASGSDYPSLHAAISDLNEKGVAGTVRLRLTDALYDTSNNIFPLVLGPVSGTSVSNRIIIESALPSGSTISSIGNSAGAVGTEGSATAVGEPAVMVLAGTDYVTLKGLNLEASNSTTLLERGLVITNASGINGATFDSIINVTVRLNRSSTTTVGISQQTSTVPSVAGGANSNNKYFNVRVYNSYAGILLTNSATASNGANPDNNNEIGTLAPGDSTIIGDNVPNDIGGGTVLTYGIKGTNQLNFKVHNAIVRNIAHNGTSAVDGIYTEGSTTVPTSCEIYNNRVYNIYQSSTSASAGVVNGIRISLTNNAQSVSRVYNNFVTGLNSASGATTARGIIGIQATGVTTTGGVFTHNIDFNTVIINPDVAGCSNTCFQIGGPSALTPTYNVRNNIFANFTGSQSGAFKHYCWVSTSATSIGNGISNRNVLHVANTDNGYVGLGATTDFATLTNWKTIATGVDANSRSEDPQFISLNTYRISPLLATPVESAGSYFGTAITWVATDIEGNARNSSTPDIGAAEGNYTRFFDDDMGPMEFTSPADETVILSGSSFSPAARFKNYGVNNQTGVPVRYRIIGPLPSTNIVYTATGTTGAVGSGATAVVTFSSTTLTAPGTYTIEAISELGADNSAANDTLRAIVYVSLPLAGTIPVGSASSFPFNSLSNAVKAVNAVGLSGSTTFSLTDADYSANERFPIEVRQLAGASASNNLVIKPASGVSTSIHGSSLNFIIRLTDADYVTLDGSNTVGGTSRNMSIINDTAIANSGAIWISSSSNGATYDTIRNCIIKAGSSTITSTFGIYAAGTTISTSGTGANNDNLVIRNNLVQRAYRGIYTRGTTTGLLDNTLITENEVGSSQPDEYVSLKGIDITNSTGITVSRNRVFNIKPASLAAIGIEIGTNVSRAHVSGNIVDSVGSTGTSSTGAYGIALTSTTGIDSVLIYNNFITDISMNTGGTGVVNVINGIRIAGGSNIYVDNNSVSLRGTYGGNSASAALMVSVNSVNGLFIRNNILVNKLTNVTLTAKAYAIYTLLGAVIDQIDNNVYFTSGSNSGHAFIDGVERPNMNQLRSATGQDAGSFRYDPNFTSGKNLHIPNGSASAVESVGMPIGYISTDIDGDTRSATPDIGADEFNGNPLDVSGPGINFAVSVKTSSTANRTFEATIIDNSGINTTTKKPRVYYKKTSEDNALTGNTSLDNGWKYTETSSTSSPFSFTIDYSLLTGGSVSVGDVIQYFVVAEDLATVPNVGVNGAEFTNTPAEVVLTAGDFPVTPVNSYQIAPALNDTVYVGAGQTFTSLTNAGGLFEAINNGVIISNTTVFITSDLTETGAIILREFAEDGAGGYYITFRTDSAVARYISGSTGSNSGLIQITGADRLVFDGRFNGEGNYLNFVNNSTNARSTVFYFKNEGTSTNTAIPGSENITIRSCNIIGGTRNQSADTYNGPYGIVFSNDIGASTVLGAAFGNRDLTLVRNRFNKLAIGVYCNTHSATPLYNTVIDSNQFGHHDDDSTISSQGMLIGNIPYGKIRHNLFVNMLQSHPTLSISGSIYGMQIYGQSVHAEVAYNTMKKFRNYEGGGIYGMSVSGDSLMVHNNLLYGFESNSSGTMSVMGINSSLNFTYIYNNTVSFYPSYMNGTNGAACIYTNSSPSRVHIRNNNLVNTMVGSTGAAPVGMYFLGTNFGNSDYNNFYVPNGLVARISGTSYSLPDWQQTTGADINSLNVNPMLNNDSNLRLLPGTQLTGKGLFLPAVPLDFAGEVRANPPTIGAYERPMDATSPFISYKKLVNTVVAQQRVVNNFATITDIGGTVDTVTGSKPRIYYKRRTDDNSLTDNTPGTPGWKYTEAVNNVSPFSFVIDYNNLFGGALLTTSDTIDYFVVAQDTAPVPNVTVNSADLAAPLTSVQLTPAHFPAQGNINYYLITNPLSGQFLVGAGGQFPSLTDHGGAFEVLNNSAISSDIELFISGNIAEPAIHQLNAIAETGPGNYTVRITGTGISELSGNSDSALIRLNGVRRVIIDGNVGGMRALTFSNAGKGAVIEFSSQAKLDTLKNVIIRGNTDLTDRGLITIKDDCDSLHIYQNLVRELSSAPANAIYAGGTLGTNDAISIDSNEIINFSSNGIQVIASSNGSNWRISSNDFYYNLSPATTNQTAISFLAGAASENIRIENNRIGGAAISASGGAWLNTGASVLTTFRGISVNAGSVTSGVTVSGNMIRNIKLTGDTAMAFIGIEQLSGSGNAVITGNVIGDSVSTDSIVIYNPLSTLVSVNCGILSNSGNERLIANNKIWGITSYGTKNNNVIGISYSGSGKSEVSGNTIHNLFSAGSESSETVARSVTGIFSGSDNKAQAIRKNRISGLVGTGGGLPTGSASTIVRAIMVNSTNSGGKISQNSLSGIENRSSGSGEVHGVYFFTGANNARWTVDNNAMHLTNGGGTNDIRIEGVHDRNANPNREIALVNNTIYIGGSVSSGASGSACYYRSVASLNTLQNNIFYNERSGGTGRHVAISNMVNPPLTNWQQATENYNLLVATDTSSIIEWGTPGNVVSPAAYKAASSSGQFSYFAGNQELVSIFFFGHVAAGDLSVNINQVDAWAANGKGKAVDTLAYSIDDSVRSAVAGLPVDLGAYEFTPLSSPPVIQSFVTGSVAEVVYLTRKLASLNFTSGVTPGIIYSQYYSGDAPVTSVPGKKINSYSVFSQQGGSGYTYDITYAYTPAEISNVPQTSLKLARSSDNGASYTYYPASVANTSLYNVSHSGLTDFGIITLTDMANPLPVKLTAFSAVRAGNDALISWNTASEINVAHFTVEASADGRLFETIGSTEAKGQSSGSASYRIVHHDARSKANASGYVYYRLRSADLDGRAELSDVVSVHFGEAQKLSDAVVAYPNPFDSRFLLNIPAEQSTTAELTLTDIRGNRIRQQVNELVTGTNEIVLDNLEGLETGVYFIRITTAAGTKVIKLIKN